MMIRTITACLIIALATSYMLAAEPATRQATFGAASVTLYDPDPRHPWNRLHEVMFGRTLKDGSIVGLDQPDPLLWPESTYLLEEPGHKAVLDALDELLRTFDEKQTKNPLKQAVLQHDLWAVFDWVSREPGVPPPDPHLAARTALIQRLSAVLARLALSKAQIEALPDNYATAVKSGTYAAQFNPERPGQSFLPPDMLDEKGPWVCVMDYGVTPGIRHSEFVSARSAFLVFINLPGGRKSTISYLRKLNAFSEPYRLNPKYGLSGDPLAILLNSEMPQFPKGTQVALVRQMILPDRSRQLAPTSLVESVQLRVYRTEPGPLPADRHPVLESVRGQQAFFEFEMRREKLFAGDGGGLESIAETDRSYVQFQSHQFDPIEYEPSHDKREVRMNQCVACHALPGIFSFNTSFPFGQPTSPRPMTLSDASIQYARQAAIRAKQGRYDWGLLKGFLQNK